MKRNILLFGCIISCLILVSLSYQPIIAEKPVVKQTEEILIVEDEDCGCISKDTNWAPPFLCLVIGIQYVILSILLGFFTANPTHWIVDYILERHNRVEELLLRFNCLELIIP